MRDLLYRTFWLLFLLATCFLAFTQARRPHKAKGSTGTASFECQTLGLFPDPNNCQYYYKCQSGGTHTRYKCGPRQRYSVQLQSCAMSSTVVCFTPVYKCKAVGDQGAWPGDSRIHFTCKTSGNGGKLQPVLFKCVDGTLFNGEARKWNIVDEDKGTYTRPN